MIISESWWIEEQWSNYTSWRYTARFLCGARCVGHARVTAHDSYADEGAGAGEGVPRHGATARAHQVLLELSTCRTLLFLPWPSFCDDITVEASVRSDGAAGSRYAEAAQAHAPLLSALLEGAAPHCAPSARPTGARCRRP
ncbi:hypothetical protein MSG28_003768 [Choristoneura fumiferana]|uniref:Uncharacterized protein n=1 Tax=Choristoneura fumiferana TaxID=7141 RepID=A0ACC0KGV3_CHOFU|nr:hypothetical protein MSG28_003768 [Choristoneura fumiferana]